MSYAKALAALKAYEPQRLIAARYYSEGECCAIGAIAPACRCEEVRGGLRINVIVEDDVFAQMFTGAKRQALSAIAAEVRALGLSALEAERLQRVNDVFRGTPEERYARVLGWLEERVASEVST